jgi:hypothetical protein
MLYYPSAASRLAQLSVAHLILGTSISTTSEPNNHAAGSGSGSGSTSALPPELLLYIFSQFVHGIDDLERCARVCRAWLYPARSALYYSPSIQGVSRLTRFVASVARNSHLAELIRELRLTLTVWAPEDYSIPESCRRHLFLALDSAINLVQIEIVGLHLVSLFDADMARSRGVSGVKVLRVAPAPEILNKTFGVGAIKSLLTWPSLEYVDISCLTSRASVDGYSRSNGDDNHDHDNDNGKGKEGVARLEKLRKLNLSQGQWLETDDLSLLLSIGRSLASLWLDCYVTVGGLASCLVSTGHGTHLRELVSSKPMVVDGPGRSPDSTFRAMLVSLWDVVPNLQHLALKDVAICDPALPQLPKALVRLELDNCTVPVDELDEFLRDPQRKGVLRRVWLNRCQLPPEQVAGLTALAEGSGVDLLIGVGTHVRDAFWHMSSGFAF